jgi:hypothetical protein
LFNLWSPSVLAVRTILEVVGKQGSLNGVNILHVDRIGIGNGVVSSESVEIMLVSWNSGA